MKLLLNIMYSITQFNIIHFMNAFKCTEERLIVLCVYCNLYCYMRKYLSFPIIPENVCIVQSLAVVY